MYFFITVVTGALFPRSPTSPRDIIRDSDRTDTSQQPQIGEKSILENLVKE
jgi:hypothetical protein